MITDIRISSTDVALTDSGCFNQEVEIDRSGMVNSGWGVNDYHVEVSHEFAPDALPQSYSFNVDIETDDGLGGTVVKTNKIWVNFISDL